MEFRKLLQIFEATPTPYKGTQGARDIAAASGIKNVNKIRAGQSINIPGSDTPYIVQKGDTLDKIARRSASAVNPNQAAVDASNRVQADQTAAVKNAQDTATDTSTNDPYNPATDPSLQAGYKEIASPVDNTADASAGANNSNGAAAALANMGRNANQNANSASPANADNNTQVAAAPSPFMAAPVKDVPNPPAGSAAKPAEKVPDNVAPVVKTGTGGTLTDRSGNPVTSRSADEIANTGPYGIPKPTAADRAQGEKNWQGIKNFFGFGDKTAPAGGAAKPVDASPNAAASMASKSSSTAPVIPGVNASATTPPPPPAAKPPVVAMEEELEEELAEMLRLSGLSLNEKAPPTAKGERMVKHIKAGYAKNSKLTDVEKRKAYGAAWKAHNKEKVSESIELVDESRETLKHIANRFKHEVRNFMNSGFMDDDLYHALHDYYRDKGEIPYSVIKDDPHGWIEERFYMDMGSGMTEGTSGVDELTELARLAGLTEDGPGASRIYSQNQKSVNVGKNQSYRDTSGTSYDAAGNPATKDSSKMSKKEYYQGHPHGISYDDWKQSYAAKGIDLDKMDETNEDSNPYRGVPSERGTSMKPSQSAPSAQPRKPSQTTPPAAGQGSKPQPRPDSTTPPSSYPSSPGEPPTPYSGAASAGAAAGTSAGTPEQQKAKDMFDPENFELTECGDMGTEKMGQSDSMNVSTNMSSDGNKSVNISAQGSKADALLQMLKMAGLRPHDDHDHEEAVEPIAIISTDSDEMLDESGMRLYHKLHSDDGTIMAKVYKDSEWNEYVVKYTKMGQLLPPDTWYHTDDMEDAVNTAHKEIEFMQQRGNDEMMEDAGGVQVHDLSRMSGREIYDETQTNDDIHDGDVLLTTSGVGIMVEAWPVLVAGDIDGFHKLKDTSWEEFEGGKYLDSYNKAMEASGQGLEEEYANTPNKEYHTVGSILRQGNDLNREKQQWNPDRARDNPMAFDLEESLAEMLESIKVKEEESTWLQKQPSKSQAEIAADWDRRVKADSGEIEAEKPYRDAKTGKMITPPRGATNPPADSQYPPGDKRNMMPPGRK